MDEPTDTEAFRDELTALLAAARANDVSVERAWQCRTDDGDVWEVEVVPVAPNAGTEAID